MPRILAARKTFSNSQNMLRRSDDVMSCVALQNVSKTFRSERGQTIHALREITFEMNPGELLVLVGPSGAGKSTLLRVIAGLEQPSSGTIYLNGEPANG